MWQASTAATLSGRPARWEGRAAAFVSSLSWRQLNDTRTRHRREMRNRLVAALEHPFHSREAAEPASSALTTLRLRPGKSGSVSFQLSAVTPADRLLTREAVGAVVPVPPAPDVEHATGGAAHHLARAGREVG